MTTQQTLDHEKNVFYSDDHCHEDSGKSIIVGFINEQWKTDWKVAYVVRFDSAHQVLSVKKPRGMTHEETELALADPKKQRE